VSLIAREHDVNANLVFRWRHQYQEGAFGPVNQSACATFLPVQVIEASTDVSQTAQPQLESHSELVVEVGICFLFVRPAFASGFLQIRSHPRHPCLWLTLPLAGCVEDFHLQVTSVATTAKLVAFARNAPCLAHRKKGGKGSLCRPTPLKGSLTSQRNTP
jgi:hypothetical protein